MTLIITSWILSTIYYQSFILSLLSSRTYGELGEFTRYPWWTILNQLVFPIILGELIPHKSLLVNCD